MLKITHINIITYKYTHSVYLNNDEERKKE